MAHHNFTCHSSIWSRIDLMNRNQTQKSTYFWNVRRTANDWMRKCLTAYFAARTGRRGTDGCALMAVLLVFFSSCPYQEHRRLLSPILVVLWPRLGGPSRCRRCRGELSRQLCQRLLLLQQLAILSSQTTQRHRPLLHGAALSRTPSSPGRPRRPWHHKNTDIAGRLASSS